MSRLFPLEEPSLAPKLFSGSVLLVGLFFALHAGAQDTDSNNPPPPQNSGGDFAVTNPQAEKLPTDVILVKGAVASATDSTTPLPESGVLNEKIYTNAYFDFSYALPPEWREKYVGPPPSDSGYYVLAQLEPTKALHGAKTGTIMITAQDLFFSRNGVSTAQEMVSFRKGSLATSGADYVVERQPTQVSIAGHTFYRLDYTSPVAELHWYTLTTQIRCHTVEFMMTSRDTTLLEGLVQSIEKIQHVPPPPGASAPVAPVCIKNYAEGNNVLHRVTPVLTDRKFNPIPVRITIDRYGKVKHIHVISAFPDQAKTITEALLQWEFKPYVRNGEPQEVETGLMFGVGPQQRNAANSRTRVSD
jgi:hypothetical protein